MKQDAEKNYVSTGLWVSWYENGQKHEEVTFRDGKLEGPYIAWYESGRKKAEGNYKNGKLEGHSTTWYENGQKKVEGDFKDDDREGHSTIWYENGQKEVEGSYKNGKLEGHATTWHENGQKEVEGSYKNGKLESFSADIMLITSDRTDVNCAAATGIGEYRCDFSDENMPWNGDEQNKLKPFYTTDRNLYLIPGLFLQSSLQERVKSEPPEGRLREQLKRFTAKCNLKVAGKVGGVRVRWLPTGAWSNPEEVEVATVVDCKVDG